MKKILATLLCFLVTVQFINSQTPEDIVKKYLEGIGGEENWKTVKSVKMAGNLETPQGEFPFTIYRKFPDKFKITLDVMGQEMVPQAYDGVIGWTINPFSGDTIPQKLSENETKALRDESAFEDPLIDYKVKGYEVTYEGTGDADGINCYILKLTKNKGIAEEEKSTTFYFSTENYLQMLVKQTSVQLMGEEIEVYLSDYQETGNGLLIPYVMDTRYQGQTLHKLNFSSIVMNEDIPDNIFAFPGDTTTVIK